LGPKAPLDPIPWEILYESPLGGAAAPRATATGPDAAEAAAHGAPRRDEGGGRELRAELRDPAPRALHRGSREGRGAWRAAWVRVCRAIIQGSVWADTAYFGG